MNLVSLARIVVLALVAAAFAPAHPGLAAPQQNQPGKNVLKLPPQGKPQAQPARPAPPPPSAAPRAPVEVKDVPHFVPPGPPPLDESQLRPAVAAVLKAASLSPSDDDVSRWVDGGPCWVWVAVKRDLPWAKHRFSYTGGCKQGRADGAGKLKAEGQDAQGVWAPLYEIEGVFLSGVLLAEVKEGSGAKLAIGLRDRSALLHLGSGLNDEADVFAAALADDQGRLSLCQAKALLAVTGNVGADEAALRQILRRSVAVMIAECPDRIQQVWRITLAGREGLAFSSQGGVATVSAILAQAEIRDGVTYAFSPAATAQPTLLSLAKPVEGAPALVWTEPGDGDKTTLMLVVGVPLFLLILLQGVARFAAARANRQRP